MRFMLVRSIMQLVSLATTLLLFVSSVVVCIMDDVDEEDETSVGSTRAEHSRMGKVTRGLDILLCQNKLDDCLLNLHTTRLDFQTCSNLLDAKTAELNSCEAQLESLQDCSDRLEAKTTELRTCNSEREYSEDLLALLLANSQCIDNESDLMTAISNASMDSSNPTPIELCPTTITLDPGNIDGTSISNKAFVLFCREAGTCKLSGDGFRRHFSGSPALATFVGITFMDGKIDISVSSEQCSATKLDKPSSPYCSFHHDCCIF